MFKPLRKREPGWNENNGKDLNGQPLDAFENLSHISHQEQSIGQSAVQYDSEGDNFRDKRDSKGLLGVMMASQLNKNKKKVLKKRNAFDKVNESRESVGSFSELVLEQYDKMNLDPKLGYNGESESEAG